MSREPWQAQRIGNLRERITLTGDAEIIGYDGFNEPIYGDPVERTVYARAEPIKSDERIAAGQISAYAGVTFHVRYLDDIKATWTITWKGSTFNIVGWRNLDERRRFLAVDAKAKAA